MSFTVNNVQSTTAAATAVTLTISISTGHTVVAFGLSIGGTNGVAGTFTDSSGSNTYSNGKNIAGPGGYASRVASSGYFINLPSGITSVTFTSTAGSNPCGIVVYDITATGTIQYADSEGIAYNANCPNTTDGFTSGSVTITGADALLLGYATSLTGATVTAGTGFTSDGGIFMGDDIYEHKAVSSSAACTWTDATNNDTAMCVGVAFQLPSIGAKVAWLS